MLTLGTLCGVLVSFSFTQEGTAMQWTLVGVIMVAILTLFSPAMAIMAEEFTRRHNHKRTGKADTPHGKTQQPRPHYQKRGKEMSLATAEFSERARQAIKLAAELAAEENSTTITPEHLATATLAQTQGVAARAISNANVSLENLFPTLPEHDHRAARPLYEGEQAGLNPQTKEVIELAANRAKEMNHSYIGTEHIIMGVLLHAESQTAVTLAQADIDDTTFTSMVNAILQGKPNVPKEANSSFNRLAHTKAVAARALDQIQDEATPEEQRLELASEALNEILQV